MAGQLPREPEQFAQIPGSTIAIIASMWHGSIVDGMVSRARTELHRVGVEESQISVHHLPGSLELPLAARILFERDEKLDAILAFGVVLKGATTHNDTVLQQVAQGFTLVSERFGKPIINEVIGVTDLGDAINRSGADHRNKGVEAVFALSEFISWRRALGAVKRGSLGF